MKFEIKHRWNGAVLFALECGSLKLCVEAAVKSRADLRGADLSRADLSDADLRDADLRGADLRGADLSRADLSDAVLSRADLRGADLSRAVLSRADLSRADLRDADLRGAVLSRADLRGADLSRADLSRAVLSDAVLSDAVLSGAVLRDADLRDCPVKIENIHQAVYAAASQPYALDMGKWHCGTAHCRAGWVVTLAGAGGAALEYAMGTPAAAALIYMASDPTLERIPNFYTDNNTALEDMKRLAELETAKAA